MTFPFTIKGEIRLSSLNGEKCAYDSLIENIATGLRYEGASVGDINKNHIRFTRPYMFFESWKPLSLIERGEIQILQHHDATWAKYEISYGHLYITTFIFCIAMFVIGVLRTDDTSFYFYGMLFLGFIIVAVHIVPGLGRFEAFIKKSSEKESSSYLYNSNIA